MNENKYNRRKKILMAALYVGALLLCYSIPVSASAAITGKIDNLKNLVLGIIQSAGAIVLLWGVFEFASAYQSRDTTQQTESLKKIVSGLLMVGAGTVVGLLQ